MAYLMQIMTFDQAYRHILTKHNAAFDNGTYIYFEDALRAWQCLHDVKP